ncbi:hypothetical protein BH10ACI1_BH10ACI1_10510 [soil metagenome]
MSKSIEFEISHEYDTREVGITVKTKLTYSKEFVEFYAKIDTGASYCIFERIHGENIGIKIENGEKIRISTATNYFDAYAHELTINVLGIETVSTVYFAKEESFTRNVLGRQGWLDRVKLGLIDYESKLFLSEYNK